MKVVFTPSGRKQFLDILAYLNRENPSAALSLRQKAGTILARLRDYPESGRVLPEFPDLPYREVIIAPYRFFYRIKDKKVWIVAVWHGAQLPSAPHLDDKLHRK